MHSDGYHTFFFQYSLCNMTTKQRFKCLRSSIIILHFPSNAVIKLRLCDRDYDQPLSIGADL